MKRLFTQFSFPGGIPSHVAPETPGLDPRGRRTGLRALARVRGGVRQPRPDRGVRRRRRRGRDGAAGDFLALQQVPEPGHRWRGPADPASQWLQDRQPVRAGATSATKSSITCSAGTATRPISSKGTNLRRCISCMAGTLDTIVEEVRRIQADARGNGAGRSGLYGR